MVRPQKPGVPRVRERGVLRGRAWATCDQPGQPQGDEVGINKVGEMSMMVMKIVIVIIMRTVMRMLMIMTVMVMILMMAVMKGRRSCW